MTFSLFDLAQGYRMSESQAFASMREETIEWSIRQTRESLVEWYAFELDRLADFLREGRTDFSETAKELEIPREMRREIEREMRKTAKRRLELVGRITKARSDVQAKLLGKNAPETLAETAKAIFAETAKTMAMDEAAALFLKQFVSNLEELAPVFRLMDSKDDSKALAEIFWTKSTADKATAKQVAADVRWRLAILLSAIGKSAYSVSQAKDELSAKVAALTSEVWTKDVLEKQVRRLERQLRESEARAERSSAEASAAAARNGELRSQITELNRQIAELRALRDPASATLPSDMEASEPEDIRISAPNDAKDAANKGDETLLAYAISLEGDLSLLRQQNESNARTLSEQAAYLRTLEDRLAEARRENDRVRDSSAFMTRIERDVEGAVPDDLVRYLALSDAPIEIKEQATANVVAFFERFLQATTKGASSGMNVNGGESWTACGKYSNNLVNPVFNYLKGKGRSLHPQRFLDQMCQVEWGALLDEYSGGEAVAMGNKKERVVTGVRNLFRNAGKRLPLFSAIGYLADMLEEYDVGNADLGRLAGNMRTAVLEDPVKRQLKDLVISLIPVRAADGNE